MRFVLFVVLVACGNNDVATSTTLGTATLNLETPSCPARCPRGLQGAKGDKGDPGHLGRQGLPGSVGPKGDPGPPSAYTPICPASATPVFNDGLLIYCHYLVPQEYYEAVNGDGAQGLTFQQCVKTCFGVGMQVVDLNDMIGLCALDVGFYNANGGEQSHWVSQPKPSSNFTYYGGGVLTPHWKNYYVDEENGIFINDDYHFCEVAHDALYTHGDPMNFNQGLDQFWGMGVNSSLFACRCGSRPR